jgi:adenosylmethionine-8-amino-7-oxononanoate aminotransferase
MALGVTACNNKIYEAYVNDDKYKTFFHGHSFTANPLACTAALASLDLLEKEDCRKKIEWISQVKSSIYHTVEKSDPCQRCKTLGTILAFEIAQGKDEYLNNISAPSQKWLMEMGCISGRWGIRFILCRLIVLQKKNCKRSISY